MENKYRLIWVGQGGRPHMQYFETFNDAFAEYILILQTYEDSCWAEDVYKDTKIQKWDENSKRWINVK